MLRTQKLAQLGTMGPCKCHVGTQDGPTTDQRLGFRLDHSPQHLLDGEMKALDSAFQSQQIFKGSHFGRQTDRKAP